MTRIRRSMVRLLTYNVHRWVGTDRKISYERIADVIASTNADIVSLQESRAGRLADGDLDQTQALADLLGMHLHFQPTICMFGQQYGLSVLTRLPSERIKGEALPTASQNAQMEKRSALWVRIETDEGMLNVINTHLSLRPADRIIQAQTLLGKNWAGKIHGQDERLILMGDLNAPAMSRTYKFLKKNMQDVQVTDSTGKAKPTFHTRLPVARLDHIFLKGEMTVSAAGPWVTPVSKVASDHLPLVADISFNNKAATKALAA